MKAQLKAREDGGWKKVEWSLVRRPHLHELEVVHGRLIAQNPKVNTAPPPSTPLLERLPGPGCAASSYMAAQRDKSLLHIAGDDFWLAAQSSPTGRRVLIMSCCSAKWGISPSKQCLAYVFLNVSD